MGMKIEDESNKKICIASLLSKAKYILFIKLLKYFEY